MSTQAIQIAFAEIGAKLLSQLEQVIKIAFLSVDSFQGI